MVYLDDGWGTDTVTYCKWVSDCVRNDLQAAGFVINAKKSVWVPCPQMEWLGYWWDLEGASVTMPGAKITSLKQIITQALSNGKLTARFISKVTGKLMSTSFVFGNICQIMSRHLYSLIDYHLGWDTELRLTVPAREELEFWLKHLDTLPGRSLIFEWKVPERIIFCDASNFAGAGILLQSRVRVAHFMFDKLVQAQSSTYRELIALHQALLSFSRYLNGKFVKVYSDNQNIVRITSKGSTVKSLQVVARQIFDFCLSNGIVLEVAWIPRHLNQISDFYSKQFDFDDWGVSDKIFQFINKKWGPLTYDRFADSQNTKLKSFN